MESNESSGPIAALYAVRVGVGVCSSLSLIGACIIILSYAAFPELRTTARQLLLNLSIADIITSLAFLLGLIQNSATIKSQYVTDNGTIPYWICEMQAFSIVFAANAATLWTISVGVYFFVTIALQMKRSAKRLLPAFYAFSWGVSLVVVLWLLLTGSLGFEPGGDPAFCGILSTVVVDDKDVDADYPILAGYEGWTYLAFIVLPMLFLPTIFQDKRIKRIEKKESSDAISLVSSESSSSSSAGSNKFINRMTLSKMTDSRVVLVPVVYMLLKFWGIAVDISIYFISNHARERYREDPVSSVLIFLWGIGRSLPGFVHGIIFCVLTKEVRETMIQGFWSGLTNCETCIYDKYCGFICCKRITNNMLSDKSTVRPAAGQEMLNAAANPAGDSIMFDDCLSEYDIVIGPDPTSSVSIVEVENPPRFVPHFQDTEQD